MEQNITTSDLQRLDLLKFGPVSVHGGGPKLRDRFACRTPENWRETLVDQLVTPSTRWPLTMWKVPGTTGGAHGASGP